MSGFPSIAANYGTPMHLSFTFARPQKPRAPEIAVPDEHWNRAHVNQNAAVALRHKALSWLGGREAAVYGRMGRVFPRNFRSKLCRM
jgi:hypothetical protein